MTNEIKPEPKKKEKSDGTKNGPEHVIRDGGIAAMNWRSETPSSDLVAYWHNQTGDGDTRRHPLQKVKAAGMEPTADEYRSTNYRLS